MKTEDNKQHVELRVHCENVAVCLCMSVRVKKQGSRGDQSKQGSQGKGQWPHG